MNKIAFIFASVSASEIDLSNCTGYNDGCNSCGVENGQITYCTEMWCEKPGEPYCTSWKKESEQVATEGCISWYAGCNTCSVNSDRSLEACTEMGCEAQTEPYCKNPENKPDERSSSEKMRIGAMGAILALTISMF